MRRFASKARDYMRAYCAGPNGLDTDACVLNLKTHRCALDTHTAFIISDDVDYCRMGSLIPTIISMNIL